MFIDTNEWSSGRKAQFLAVVAHEITVCARGTYEIDSENVVRPKLLRAYNELQHRATASLRDYLRDKEGIPISLLLKMLEEFGLVHNCQNEIELVISRAQQLTIDNHL